MDIFTRFKTSIKIRDVLVDNNIFQLHYRVTALFLLGCAALVASKQHFGDPIDCITRDDVPNKIMDTYCWIHATFTLMDACNKTIGFEVPHPCVDRYNQSSQERVYHKYYQWVYFVLFFQAACFYAPHFFWKACESKLMVKLCIDFKDPFFNDKEKRKKAKDVIQYLDRHRFQHQQYFHYFTIFETLNLFNVIMQMYLVDEFLGGTFTTYGLDVIRMVQEDTDIDPMARVFPKMTKCTFHRYGSSGDVQRHDALCILPLNIINEKIYIIMWFWFVFLASITALWLLYRLLTFFKPSLRYESLRRRASLTDRKRLKLVLDNSNSGDWFLLSMMCKNMDSQCFRYIIFGLSKRIQSEQSAGKSSNNHAPNREPLTRSDDLSDDSLTIELGQS